MESVGADASSLTSALDSPTQCQRMDISMYVTARQLGRTRISLCHFDDKLVTSCTKISKLACTMNLYLK
jgi:hypothetical protein